MSHLVPGATPQPTKGPSGAAGVLLSASHEPRGNWMRWFFGICSFGRDSDLRGITSYLSARLDRGRAPAMIAAVLARADTGRLRRSS
jgi:hypothetical protein